MISARIIGAGHFVPSRSVSNERIARAIPGWPADKIAEKTGIRERRFLWDFDDETGRALPPPTDSTFWPRSNVDMCELALRRALEMADIGAESLDALFVVTVSPDEINFCHDAMAIHRRLKCRSATYALVIDSGCAGGLYVFDMARRMIEGGTFRTIGIVASTFASAYLDRDVFTSEVRTTDGAKPINAYLSMYVFGDGAGAVLLHGEEARDARSPGVIASTAGSLGDAELVIRRGGGALRPAHNGRSSPADHAFVVDGPLVAQNYPVVMQRCLDELFVRHRDLPPDVVRFYLHQPNRRVLDSFIQKAGIPAERVPITVDWYGNTSAAGPFILFSEDLERGEVRLGSGDLVAFASVGAGVHYGGQLVRL